MKEIIVYPGFKIDNRKIIRSKETKVTYLQSYKNSTIIEEVIYYRFGEIHREDGPAAQRHDESGNVYMSEWYRGGKLHREDGPAIIFHKGKKDYEEFFDIPIFLFGSKTERKSRIFGRCSWSLFGEDLDDHDIKKLNSFKSIEKVKTYLAMLLVKHGVNK